MRSIRRFFRASFLLLISGLLFAADASARQCIFNKGGYVLKVSWYRRGDLGRATGPQAAHSLKVISVNPPASDESISAGFGSCNNSNDIMIAVVGTGMCGGIQFSDGKDDCRTRISPGVMLSELEYNSLTGQWQVSKPASPLECITSPGSHGYCLPSDYNVLGSTGLFWSGRNNFLITEPSTTRYLDFWGTVDTIQWGPGGGVNGYGWVDGVDPTILSDNGRGVTDWNAHASWVAGGASLTTAAGYVGTRATTLSGVASREHFARLYASLSVIIGAVGRAHAGWVNGVDPKVSSDPGRGIADYNAHYNWLAGTSTVPLTNGANFIGQRMNQLTGVPRDVYAKLYADVSVVVAKCGTTGLCGN